MSKPIDRIPAMTRTRALKAPDGPAITPRGIKVQYGPSHPYDDRYQVDPASRPFGAGFAAAKPGIDITTGKPWGQA